MREIKFRAWNGKKMYYPILDKGCVYRNDRDYEDAIDYTDPVMQYVDMKDRNGKEIYEGDIVTILQTYDEDFVRTYEIKMINGSWCFQRLYGDYHIAKLGDLFSFGRQNFGIKVIGNIYENPELLGELK